MDDSLLVDVDDLETWPAEVRAWVDKYRRLRGSTKYTLDLEVPAEREDEFRSLLGGHKVLTFHCTRLLEHEADRIRQHGLRRLTKELVAERILEAHTFGSLTDEQRRYVEDKHAFAGGWEQHREGRVCLVIGRAAFDEDPDACVPLLESWGGEAIYRGLPDSHPIRKLGRPAIVAAVIDLSVSARVTRSFPDLSKVFVGKRLGLDDASGEAHLMSDIPGADVVAVWHPGEREYDRHSGLPRS